MGDLAGMANTRLDKTAQVYFGAQRKAELISDIQIQVSLDH